MSLDKNLFTLSIKHQSGGVLDLVDTQGEVHYRKRPGFVRSQQDHLDNAEKEKERQVEKEMGVPSFDIYDPLSDGLLATLRSNPSTSSKRRVIQLHNPTVMVDMQFTGSLSFKWQFDWETHTFEFKREECFLLRKPDPPVLVAVYKLERNLRPGGFAEGESLGQLQLLDYNLTRFDIDDRKGLEIVILTGILSFQDTIGSASSAASSSSAQDSIQRGQSANIAPIPVLPPKDPSIAIGNLQAKEKSEVNEIVVTSAYDASLYAEHASNLLKDPNLLYVVFRSKTEAEVPKVVAIAEMTKRLRYKGGAHDEDLYQYVKYDEEKDAKKGPRVIKLDDPGDGPGSKPLDYKPPTRLSIHLSKIPMPELQPKVKPSNDRLSTRPLSANKDNRMSFAGPPPGRMTGSGGSTPARSRSQEARQKPDRRARTPSPGRDREPGKVLQKQKQKERGRDQPQQQPQGRQPGRSPVGQRRSGSNSPPRRMMPHAQSHGKTPNHHLGGGPSGPESPRTSFWNFYNPPAGGPSSRQPQPSHPHRSSSQGDSPQNTETMYNALWGSNPSGRSDPPGRRRSPQDHHSGTQSPILPGSYPSGHFPPGGPPPPPPQVQQPRPQTHQTGGGGSNSGLGSFIGGLVPPQSQGGSGGGNTASQAAHLVGHVGMSLYEKFAKSSNSRN